MRDLLKKYFPAIIEQQLVEIISNNCSLIKMKTGKTIMKVGDRIRILPLVIDGIIKVSREDENGEELLLYFLYPGQTCSLTVNCCTSEKPSEIKAVVEENSSYIAIPIAYVNLWIDKFPSWRNFLFASYSARFSELLSMIDSIAFSKMDVRLKKYLEYKSRQSSNRKLDITHQQIAIDLHTSREAISRLLKKLQINGEVELGRNHITLM